MIKIQKKILKHFQHFCRKKKKLIIIFVKVPILICEPRYLLWELKFAVGSGTGYCGGNGVWSDIELKAFSCWLFICFRSLARLLLNQTWTRASVNLVLQETKIKQCKRRIGFIFEFQEKIFMQNSILAQRYFLKKKKT